MYAEVRTKKLVVNQFPWLQYRLFVVVTALLHGASAVAIFVIGRKKDWPVRVCASYSTWKPLNAAYKCFDPLPNGDVNTCSVGLKYRHVGSLSPVVLLSAFSLLSFVFQVLPAVTEGTWRTYRLNCESGVQPLRWIEYSLSATLMVMVILVLNGNYDAWIFLSAGALTWATMMFGLMHEYMLWAHLKLSKITGVRFGALENTRAHLAGWVTYAATWMILITQFSWSIQDATDLSRANGFTFPKWIITIIWLQFSMFNAFGINQLAATASQLGWLSSWSYLKSEVTYTVLSVAAKQLLVWFLYFGTIMRDPTKLIPSAPC